MLNYIILMCCIRVGEAQNPGPSKGCHPQDNGTFNKEWTFGEPASKTAQDLPAGAWGAT